MIYGEVDGGFGTRVKIEKSTLKPKHAWLFVRNSPNGPVTGALHIDRSQAKDIRDSLAEFLGDS